MSKMFGMALAGALAIGTLAAAAPAAEAGGKHKHHFRFHYVPYHFHTFHPVCGKWFWSYKRQKFVCAWWY